MCCADSAIVLILNDSNGPKSDGLVLKVTLLGSYINSSRWGGGGGNMACILGDYWILTSSLLFVCLFVS